MYKAFKFILILALGFSSIAHAEKEELSSTQIKKLKNGIFEVVSLKLADNAVYKEEFPHDLIPFHIRKDKYHSLGTAFLIKENTFVSAAHVFNLEYQSLLSDSFAVRDTKGKLYKISNVEKYSNYRDLIQFTVEGDTSKYHKFDLAENYEEGDVVYAAGNALGEGVIFRKGSLTSFTYEPIDGKWKNIRYSAAASPGNSGGPLLNLKGDVVGIVTQKSSNENLNYAFPIKEFTEFSAENAEFFSNQMAEVESLQRLRYSWNYSTKLPQGIMELRALAEESFYTRFINARDKFVDKYQQEIFPHHKNVFKYLKNQSSKSMLTVIDINGNGEWTLYRPEEDREIKIDKNQSLLFSANNKIMGGYQFNLDKPEGESLEKFISDKKLILDTFLTSVQWNRKIAEIPVYITSYGDPVYEERHEDRYGRVWQMATWHDQYSNRALMLYCLPIPSGVACDFVETSYAWLKVQQTGYKDNLHRMMLSYSAKLSEWKEFVNLPDDMIPKQFRNSKFDVYDNKVTFEIGEFKGDLENLKLTEQSKLYIADEIDPNNINKLIVGSVNFTPNSNEDGTFYISRYYNLGEHATDNYKDFWNKFSKQESPYNFEVINEGKLITKYLNLEASQDKSNLGAAEEASLGYLVGCKLQSEVKLEEFNQSCDSFIKGLRK
jgi:V8-like Glu-specific endopeptidase